MVPSVPGAAVACRPSPAARAGLRPPSGPGAMRLLPPYRRLDVALRSAARPSGDTLTLTATAATTSEDAAASSEPASSPGGRRSSERSPGRWRKLSPTPRTPGRPALRVLPARRVCAVTEPSAVPQPHGRAVPCTRLSTANPRSPGSALYQESSPSQCPSPLPQLLP